MTVPDPKKKGQTKTASFLRVMPDIHSVLAMLQQVGERNEQAGRLSWPSCIPSDEYWVQICIDKGGGCTKIVLKTLCTEGADSVRRVTLLGLLDGVPDSYEMLDLAFGALFKSFKIIEKHRYPVYLPWKPRLMTPNIELNADLQPVRVELSTAPRIVTVKLRLGAGCKIELALYLTGSKTTRFRRLKFSEEEVSSSPPPPPPPPPPPAGRRRRRRSLASSHSLSSRVHSSSTRSMSRRTTAEAASLGACSTPCSTPTTLRRLVGGCRPMCIS